MAKKILIVDDDPFILDMYALKFKERGFDVEVGRDGKAGLAKVKEIQPDILLLDIVMPGMDGFEVLKTLKEKAAGPLPKIVFLTNFGQKDDIERGLQLGADDYIIKAHYTPTEVVEKIEQILARAPAQNSPPTSNLPASPELQRGEQPPTS